MHAISNTTVTVLASHIPDEHTHACMHFIDRLLLLSFAGMNHIRVNFIKLYIRGFCIGAGVIS